MTQAESYADLWAAHRDRAGPLTPADVWGLREDREFVPPSRGHLKRLLRPRPEISIARPPVEPDRSARRSINQAAKLGHQIARQLGYVKPTIV